MDAAQVLRRARRRSGLSLRALAERAGTSHATLAAYEAGRVVPRADTLDRIVEAAGFALDAALEPRRRAGTGGATKGDELVAVLDLAGAFPARHDARLRYPVFPRP